VNGRRLRILILNWRDTRHPRAGGAEAYLWNLARHWLNAGCEVAWLTARSKGLPTREVLDGVEVHRIGGRATMYALVPLYYLTQLRGRFDVIVDSENGIPQFTPCFTRVPKVALTYHVHRRVFLAHMPKSIAWFFIWLELGLVPFLYRRVRFITISNTTKDEMLQHGKTRFPVAVIEPGIAEGLSPGLKAKEPTIIYLGRLERYKRVDHLIRALAQLRTEIPTLRLDIAGTGTEAESLRAFAQRIGVGDRVRFHDFVTEDEKRRLLQQAWVFATPSEMEGWGIGVIEAAACATPAIAYDVPGLREAIVDGETGLIAADFDQFVGALRCMLDDEQLRAKMGRAAAERAAGFGWEKRASVFLEILESTAWSDTTGTPYTQTAG
jgi:glycosyltransferase involved in cell wall biosynthesis